MQRYTIVKTVMKSLKSHQRLLIFLLSVLALTCVISPWMALGADWVAARWPSLISERVPFSRVFNRAFMIAGIIVGLCSRRYIFPAHVKALLTVGLAGLAKLANRLASGYRFDGAPGRADDRG